MTTLLVLLNLLVWSVPVVLSVLAMMVVATTPVRDSEYEGLSEDEVVAIESARAELADWTRKAREAKNLEAAASVFSPEWECFREIPTLLDVERWNEYITHLVTQYREERSRLVRFQRASLDELCSMGLNESQAWRVASLGSTLTLDRLRYILA